MKRSVSLSIATALSLLITLFCSAQFAPAEARSTVSTAQDDERITGQWLVEREGGESARLTLSRRTERGGTHESSFDIPLEQLVGLGRESFASSGARAQFKIRRDAGTFYCEGWLNNGAGSGHFTFAPSSIYLTEMRKLGYEEFSGEELLALALHDVSLRFAGELYALGYTRLGFGQLQAMRVHGVTTDFIIELKMLGYDFIPVNELVAMRVHNVTTEFIEELQSLGYFRVTVNQLVAMRIHGVTASFIEEVKARGYTNLSIQQLINMKIHGLG